MSDSSRQVERQSIPSRIRNMWKGARSRICFWLVLVVCLRWREEPTSSHAMGACSVASMPFPLRLLATKTDGEKLWRMRAIVLEYGECCTGTWSKGNLRRHTESASPVRANRRAREADDTEESWGGRGTAASTLLNQGDETIFSGLGWLFTCDQLSSGFSSDLGLLGGRWGDGTPVCQLVGRDEGVWFPIFGRVHVSLLCSGQPGGQATAGK